MFFKKKKDAEAKRQVELSAEIVADLRLIATTNKIEAIKAYRALSKSDLKTAKDFIESL